MSAVITSPEANHRGAPTITIDVQRSIMPNFIKLDYSISQKISFISLQISAKILCSNNFSSMLARRCLKGATCDARCPEPYPGFLGHICWSVPTGFDRMASGLRWALVE